jgi:hypothetical protein
MTRKEIAVEFVIPTAFAIALGLVLGWYFPPALSLAESRAFIARYLATNPSRAGFRLAVVWIAGFSGAL